MHSQVKTTGLGGQSALPTSLSLAHLHNTLRADPGNTVPLVLGHSPSSRCAEIPRIIKLYPIQTMGGGVWDSEKKDLC